MKCGCKILKAAEIANLRQDEIVFCPLHAAAEEMLAALNTAKARLQIGGLGVKDIEKAIAKASNARVTP